MFRIATVAAAAALASTAAMAQSDDHAKRCSLSPGTVQMIQEQLGTVVNMANGGLFTPNQMWSAVVDRAGVLCSVIKVGDAWPGSRDIAIAKASTANDFSNQKLALSTAMLYGPTQPGGSLYGLNNSNPFQPDFNRQGTGIGGVPGGIITFGGGVALYSNGQVIGGLGVSGDTSCADHVIAYRMRRAAGFDKVPGGVGADNIQYYAPKTTITTLDPTQFAQPHCADGDIAPGDI
jgi:uncharacterized protein GlcG (DUF336 family)